ncbi:Zinc finger BED domain-containing protein 5 [Trichinella nativa]|uniref:Zinc finger BED domain-containing protein 5 n=1 Tax=Trichinella nativa TaxID=6335 RepID=A0A0V1KWU9_9BILA|nr:Zinc finger BED domain-containing protein 5 [Trichinella nativa]
MKPSKMKDHLERVQLDKKNKDIDVDCEGGLKASYSISLNIAKKAKSYTIGEEIVIPVIKELIETVMKKDSEPVLKCIPLSAKTVQRCIDEMASDVEKTLYYSQSLKSIVDEFLFANYLVGDAKGETIFRSLEDYLKEHNVPLGNITAVATDGAPSMVGRYRGFANLLKETVPDVRAVHCVLHRHHLVAKNLSGGDYLQRLVDLNHSTLDNDVAVDVNQTLCEELKKCKNHLFYLADLYSKFHEIQKRLQGKDVSIIQARTVLIGFRAKIGPFKSFLARRDFKEDFKTRFEDLENMTVPDWIITPFDIEIENANVEFSLQEKHVEMISADLEAKLLFKHKSLSEFWSNPRKCDFIKAKEQTEPRNALRLAPETHLFPAKYQCPCCCSSNISFTLTMPRS